eukprot:4666512-Alexandrium_andersonii.AAC.1
MKQQCIQPAPWDETEQPPDRLTCTRGTCSTRMRLHSQHVRGWELSTVGDPNVSVTRASGFGSALRGPPTSLLSSSGVGRLDCRASWCRD